MHRLARRLHLIRQPCPRRGWRGLCGLLHLLEVLRNALEDHPAPEQVQSADRTSLRTVERALKSSTSVPMRPTFCTGWLHIVLHLREVGELSRGLAAVARIACELAQVLGRVRRERQQAVARGILERHHALELAQELLRGERHLHPPVLFCADDNLRKRTKSGSPLCVDTAQMGRGSNMGTRPVVRSVVVRVFIAVGALALLGVSDDAKRLALKLLHHEL